MCKVVPFVIGNLVGSIPFAWIVARCRGVDILRVGTGNPGAGNVYDNVGKLEGVIVWLLDMSKGILACWIGKRCGLPILLIFVVGGLSVLGHCYPVWLKFRGGRGVSTLGGVVLFITPKVFPIGAFFYYIKDKIRVRILREPLLIVLLFVILYLLYRPKFSDVALGYVVLAAAVVIGNIPHFKALRSNHK